MLAASISSQVPHSQGWSDLLGVRRVSWAMHVNLHGKKERRQSQQTSKPTSPYAPQSERQIGDAPFYLAASHARSNLPVIPRANPGHPDSVGLEKRY